MFVEYDLYGPDILTLNNTNNDKSTSVRAIYCFTWPVSAYQIAVRQWVHDPSVFSSTAFVGLFFKYNSRFKKV